MLSILIQSWWYCFVLYRASWWKNNANRIINLHKNKHPQIIEVPGVYLGEIQCICVYDDCGNVASKPLSFIYSTVLVVNSVIFRIAIHLYKDEFTGVKNSDKWMTWYANDEISMWLTYMDKLQWIWFHQGHLWNQLEIQIKDTA